LQVYKRLSALASQRPQKKKKISKFFFLVAYIQLTTPFRFTEEELIFFKDIMKLERGFEKVVDACAGDTDVFLALIKLVSEYMRII
jgi:hypothetical protein